MPEDHTVVESCVPEGASFAVPHLGGHDGLGQAWGELIDAVSAAGAATSALVEIYVTHPGPHADPAAMRTDLHALL